MTDMKGALSSRTVWGGIIAIGAAAAGFFGYSISETDQQALITSLSAIGAAVGGLMSIYGRIVATKRIGK